MLETVAIPILLKAVEFLFGEGSKILEERRERRKAQQKTEKGETENDATLSLDKTETTDTIQSKEVALSQPVIETAWSASESRVKHLLVMLEIYTKNYHLAKEKYAKWGSPLAPPIVVHELTEAENGIAETAAELRDILGKVYNKPLIIPGIGKNEKPS